MHEPDTLQDVMTQLDALTPPAGDARPAAPRALLRFHHQLALARSQPLSWRMILMQRWKPALAGLATLLALLFVFTFPPARAAASEFLGLFRVKKFAPISISPQQLAALEAIAQEGIFPGQLTFEAGDQPPATYPHISQALQRLRGPGFRYLDAQAVLGQPDEIAIQSGGQATLVIDLAGARALLEAVGGDPAVLPDSLEGAEIAARLYNQLLLSWGDVMMVQMSAPVVSYPADIDPALIGEALLRFLGMSDTEAYRLARNIDWTSTLILPLPTTLATFTEVRLGETTGLALQAVNEDAAFVLWQEGETLYLLGGPGQQVDDLLKLADEMKPYYR